MKENQPSKNQDFLLLKMLFQNWPTIFPIFLILSLSPSFVVELVVSENLSVSLLKGEQFRHKFRLP